MTTRQEQADATRAAILKAGYTLLSQREASQITVADIMRECGLSTGLFYHYFKSKEEFMAMLIMENWGNYRQLLKDEDLPPVPRLKKFMITMLREDILESSTRMRRNLNAYRMTDTYIRIRTETAGDDYIYTSVKDFLEDRIGEGWFSRELPVHYISSLLSYLCNGVMFTVSLLNREPDIDQTMAWFEEFFASLEQTHLKPYLLSPKAE